MKKIFNSLFIVLLACVLSALGCSNLSTNDVSTTVPQGATVEHLKQVGQKYSNLGFTYVNVYQDDKGSIVISPKHSLWYMYIAVAISILLSIYQIRFFAFKETLRTLRQLSLAVLLIALVLITVMKFIVSPSGYTSTYSNCQWEVLLLALYMIGAVLVLGSGKISKEKFYMSMAFLGPVISILMLIPLCLQILSKSVLYNSSGPWFIPATFCVSCMIVTYIAINRKITHKKPLQMGEEQQ